jgi:hypothetical protein
MFITQRENRVVLRPPSASDFRGASSLCTNPATAQSTAGTINGHTVWVDNNGNLLSWLDPSAMDSFDLFLNDITNYVVNDWPAADGKPSYYFYFAVPNEVYQIQPADTCAGFLRAGLAWLNFSGTRGLLTAAEAWADYILANGLSSGGVYNGIPFAASHSATTPYDGYEPYILPETPEYNTLEPDKAANFGLQLLRDWELTGNSSYLSAAQTIAAFLVATRNTSPDASNSPWPWRLDAIEGTVYVAYCSSVYSQIAFFDELIAQGLDSLGHYATARAAALAWLLGSNGPIATQNWSNYYEDQPTSLSNVVNTPALETAIYLCKNPGVNANAIIYGEAIIAFIQSQLGGTDLGNSTTMAEQNPQYDYITTDATSRWALANAWLASATGISSYKCQAFRSFNWVTYMLLANSGANDGKVVIGPSDTSDVSLRVGYTEPIYQLLEALTLFPEWLP